MTATSNRILVFDDERPIRKLLQIGFSAQGYKVIEASNGRTALHLLLQNPALIILDVGLPDIQVLELLRGIRGYNDAVRLWSCQVARKRTAARRESSDAPIAFARTLGRKFGFRLFESLRREAATENRDRPEAPAIRVDGKRRWPSLEGKRLDVVVKRFRPHSATDAPNRVIKAKLMDIVNK
jgi:CheY-like chemotaxis protein